MTTIRALSSMPDFAALNTVRMNDRFPDPIASGFQSQLQEQVRLSRSEASKEPVMQKQSATEPPRRADIDSMLAQLLASRKMLLQPARTAPVSAKPIRENLTACNLTDNAFSEASDANSSESVKQADSGVYEKINRKHPELRCDSCFYSLVSDFFFACPQPYPPVTLTPSIIYIWIAPEFVRAPVPFYRGNPLRIRRLRHLNQTGYRQAGRGLN